MLDTGEVRRFVELFIRMGLVRVKVVITCRRAPC